MTFYETISEWAGLFFDWLDDLYTLIMTYDFTAFAFWAVVVCGGLFLFADVILHPRDLACFTSQAERNMTAATRGTDRMFAKERQRQERQRRATEKRNVSEYAQMLLNTRDYSKSRYVTIEGKRYYRKGLVSFGKKMKSSDRDYSYDLEDIKKSKKGDKT